MAFVRGVALLAGWVTVGPTAAHAEPDPWFGHDKELHFAAAASIAVVGYAGTSLVTPNRAGRAGAALGLAAAAGAAKELADRAGYGDPSWRDLTWDVAGAVVGTAVALAVDWLVHRYVPATDGR